MNKHCSNDANLLLVALRKIANVFLFPEDFVVHERRIIGQTLAQSGIINAINGCNELEILFGCIKFYEETPINKRARIVFPSLCFIYFLTITTHKALRRFNQIENQTHERCLASTIISHQTY